MAPCKSFSNFCWSYSCCSSGLIFFHTMNCPHSAPSNRIKKGQLEKSVMRGNNLKKNTKALSSGCSEIKVKSCLNSWEYTLAFRCLKSDPNSHDWVEDKSPHLFKLLPSAWKSGCMVPTENRKTLSSSFKAFCWCEIEASHQPPYKKKSVGNPKVLATT